MKHRIRKILFLLLALTFGAHYVWLLTHYRSASIKATSTKVTYYCPMHPSVTSNTPDRCPICGMKLDRLGDETAPSESTPSEKQAEHKILYYRDPMGKSRTSPVPMKDEMGMDFIPVYEDEVSSDAKTTPVEGRVTFSIPQDTQQMIGVTKAKVKREELTDEIRAAGTVSYEPQLYQAIEEYQVALKTAAITNKLRSQADNSLLNATKIRLKLLGVSDRQLERLAKGEIDPKTFLLPEGKAWIYAEVFEYELPLISLGQKVEALVSVLPGEKFNGRISSISPIVDPSSRTVRVRAEIDDPGKLLKPNMFVNALIQASLGNEVVVPSSAVIFTGTKDLVYVVDDKGRFEPREVVLGESSSDRYAVTTGLHEGEVIVTSANFLIDSESRLRAVVAHGTAAAPTHQQ